MMLFSLGMAADGQRIFIGFFFFCFIVDKFVQIMYDRGLRLFMQCNENTNLKQVLFNSSEQIH